MESVDILLATFNGARFLPEQLESIEAQTYRGWRLIVRDDGSSDSTQSIIEAFARRHGDKVRVLQDGRGQLGVRDNFGALLAASDAPYFMFCDQDDVWLPEKIAALLGAMRDVEKRRGAETPILVHSDLIVVDEQLRVVHRSFWRYARLLDPSARRHPMRLILRNYVTGCASIGNAALRRAALPLPGEAYMHDWWVGLVAAALGEVVHHQSPTVLYRQHGMNELGAQTRSFSSIIAKFLRTPTSQVRRARFYIRKAQKQAAAFLHLYGRLLDSNCQEMISEFTDPKAFGFWRRKFFLWRYRLLPDYRIPAAICWWFL